MARVQLTLPEHFCFSTELSVRIGDINYGNHLDNAAAQGFLHEARIRFLASLGFSELNIAGSGLILADAVLVYKSQAFHGDVIRIDLAVTEFNRYGCDIYYRLRNTASARDIIHAKTGVVFFDYASQRPTRVPAAFLTALGMAAEPKDSQNKE